MQFSMNPNRTIYKVLIVWSKRHPSPVQDAKRTN